MTSIGPLHGDIGGFPDEWSVLATAGTELQVDVEADVVFDDSQTATDLVWITRRRSRDQLPGPADIRFMIEGAESSLADDIGDKAALDAEQGVAEYWVVDIHGGPVRVHTQPDGRRDRSLRQVRSGEQLTPACRPLAMLAAECAASASAKTSAPAAPAGCLGQPCS